MFFHKITNWTIVNTVKLQLPDILFEVHAGAIRHDLTFQTALNFRGFE